MQWPELNTTGQLVLNLISTIAGIVFTSCAPKSITANTDKGELRTWCAFWASLTVMYCYYVVARFAGIDYPGGKGLFNFLQLSMSLFGNSALALICFYYIPGEFLKKAWNKIVERTLYITIFPAVIFVTGWIMFHNVSMHFTRNLEAANQFCQNLIYGGLFFCMSFQFRKIEIESALIFMTYGALTIILMFTNLSEGSNNGNALSVLVALQFALLKCIYKRFEVQSKPV